MHFHYMNLKYSENMFSVPIILNLCLLIKHCYFDILRFVFFSRSLLAYFPFTRDWNYIFFINETPLKIEGVSAEPSPEPNHRIRIPQK